MNVLPFVLVMLTMLSIITYSRLQSFMQRTLVLNEFECYMQHIEHYSFNQSQEKLFAEAEKKKEDKEEKQDKIKPTTQKEPTKDDTDKSKGDADKKPNKKTDADRFINLAFLYDKSQRENHKEWYDTAYTITKNLINQLYRNKYFFQEMEEKNPGFVDQLLKTIMDKAEEQSKLKIKTPKDLANLNLENEELQDTLAKMLRGSQNTVEVMVACQKVADDKLIEAMERQGFPSLASYTMATKTMKPIRMYLAPAPLLMAIYNDERDVDAIIKYRHKLYLEVKDNGKSNDEASAEFQRLFQNKIPNHYDPTFFDYTVTKTNPDRP